MKVEQNITYPKIRQIQDGNNSQSKITVNSKPEYNPNFTGAVDTVLRFLDTEPAWGADAVDLCFMVIPRTATDFGRGANAGFETMRREGAGTTNHSAVPLYGTLAGLALASGINGMYQFGKNDVKASSVFADSETMDMMSKLYTEELKNAKSNPEAKPLRNFLVKYFKNYEALSADKNAEYVRLSQEDAEHIADKMFAEIEKEGKKPSKEVISYVRAKITSGLGGVENNLRIITENEQKPHSSRYTVETVVDNAYKLGKLFNKEKVVDAFEETITKSVEYTENAFLKAMKNMNLKRSLIGIGVASAVGVSAQPLNMYITKKRTGTTGFVGGGKEDTSTGFKIKKTLAGLAFFSAALATIGHPKNLIKNLQFKGFNPTIKQFKFIYGITIFSRFLSARNNNELAETSVKDPLGFVSWLILGNFVQKLVAQALDKDLIKKDGNGVMKWITGSVLKSRDEVLHAALGDKVFKDGKALKYGEMVKLVDKLGDKATKVKLRKLSIAQVINYAYTGLVLGIGIPKLNIYLTGRREAKNAAKEAQKQNTNPSTQPNGTNVVLTGMQEFQKRVDNRQS